jgi:hypothetical protein
MTELQRLDGNIKANEVILKKMDVRRRFGDLPADGRV